jgi:hypothetical protein
MQLTKRQTIGVVAATVLLIAIPTPSYALFGFGDIVFDPISYATIGKIWQQDISNYAKLIQTVTQLEKIYANGAQMYALGRAMSTSFSALTKLNGHPSRKWRCRTSLSISMARTRPGRPP